MSGKYQDFTVTQILRENNLGESKNILKSVNMFTISSMIWRSLYLRNDILGWAAIY